MGSGWEWVGEKVGYGLAALVLGPAALVERKSRREAKRAFLRFAHAHEPDVLDAPRGTFRRLLRLPTAEGPLHVEVRLDLSTRRALLTTHLPEMPASFEFTGGVRLDTAEEGDENANALLQEIGTELMDSMTAYELVLKEGRAELLVKAPPADVAWEAIASVVLKIAAWSHKKWAHSYRT